MWKYLICGIILLNLSCNSPDSGFISGKILNSDMQKCISDFITEHPRNNLFGLYFIRYVHDTTYFLFTTHPASESTIYDSNPDDLIRLNDKFVIINYGFNNLQKYDSSRAVRLIKNMEEKGFKFTFKEGLFTPAAIMISVKDGYYSIHKTGFTNFDVPTSKVIEDTSIPRDYVPGLNELREFNDSVDIKE